MSLLSTIPSHDGTSPSQYVEVKGCCEPVSRILVLGGAGYLGCMMVGELLRHGFAVRVLDAFLFGDRALADFKYNRNCEVIRGDLRDIGVVVQCMRGCDAVVHLAGIVGDAACNERTALAVQVNSAATPLLLRAARRCGIDRFIFASTCSVYGASERCLDEGSPLNPLSVYARTKGESEKWLLEASGPDFTPTILRLGTLFGLSPRMRFDLVVNLFVAQAASSGQITIWNGEQWRPFLHVQDAVRAFLLCVDAPRQAVAGQIFNVGGASLNYQIRELGQSIARAIPNTRLSAIENDDRRNYRVSFDKIQSVLGFRCERNLAFGIHEMYASLKSNEFANVGDGRFL